MSERGHKGALTDLTAEYVRQLFDYDPDTGVLRWKKIPQGYKGHDRIVGSGRKAESGNRLAVGIDRKRYLVHRVIWLLVTGEWPPHEVDHKDTDHRNNRWGNLRLATSSQNLSNRSAPRHNTSGYKGVSRTTVNASNPWVAYITHKGHRKTLGYFRTPEEAHACYCEAAKLLHGNFVRTE